MEDNYKNQPDETEVKSNRKKNKHENKIVLFNKMLALIAFIGIGCIAVSLILTLILKNNTKLSDAFNAVGQVIAYLICIILAYAWVRTHKQIAWIVCYVVFVVTIVVLFILTI